MLTLCSRSLYFFILYFALCYRLLFPLALYSLSVTLLCFSKFFLYQALSLHSLALLIICSPYTVSLLILIFFPHLASSSIALALCVIKFYSLACSRNSLSLVILRFFPPSCSSLSLPFLFFLSCSALSLALPSRSLCFFFY